MINYISIKQVLDDVLAHPMLQNVSLERAVNYATELIRILNVPKMYEDKIAYLDIHDYRCLLPCDFYEVIQMRIKNQDCSRPLKPSTNSFGPIADYIELTYNIQNNVLYTSLKEGTVEMAYKSIAVDEDGYPLIPDNAAFIRALESYIKKQYFTILFDKGELHQSILQNVKQEYAFNVAQASAALIMPNQDEMQDIVDQNSRLIPRTHERRRYYETMSTKERLKNI